MPRKTAHKTRNALLQAASTLFLERGIRGTTVQQICDAAGTTKGAFFHHFAHKRDAALATLDWYMDQVLSRLQVDEGPPRDRLFELMALVKDQRRFPRDPGCLVATHAIELAAVDDDVRRECRTQITRLQGLVRSYVSDALDEVGRGDVDATGLAECFITSLEGGLILGRATGDSGAFKRAMSAYEDYLRLVLDCRPIARN